MLKLLSAIFFLVLMPAAAAAQTETACSAVAPPFVDVMPVFAQPAYNLTTNIEGIQRIAKDTGHSIHESITLGITRYQSFIEFRTPVETTTFANGGACTKVRRADVTIGYRDVTVYVAREVPQGSCGFNEVVAHEQKHIAVNLEVLKEYAPRIQQSLEAYLRDDAVFAGRNRADELALLRKNLQAILDRFGERMIDDNIARQKQVDSPEEYRRLSRVCNGQLAAIAGHSLDAYR
jgi:hypothetical protein